MRKSRVSPWISSLRKCTNSWIWEKMPRGFPKNRTCNRDGVERSRAGAWVWPEPPLRGGSNHVSEVTAAKCEPNYRTYISERLQYRVFLQDSNHLIASLIRYYCGPEVLAHICLHFCCCGWLCHVLWTRLFPSPVVVVVCAQVYSFVGCLMCSVTSLIKTAVLIYSPCGCYVI